MFKKMNNEFQHSIISQIIDAIEDGNSKFVICGELYNIIFISSELNKLGLAEYITSLIVKPGSSTNKKINGINLSHLEEIHQIDFDTLVIASDEHKEDILLEFSKIDNRIPKVIIAGTKHMDFHDEIFHKLKSSCLVKSYANGYVNTLIHLYQSIEYLAKNDIIGDVVEFGIFKGGTTVFIAKVLKHFGFHNTKIYGFDIFEGFPKSKTIFDLYSNPKCEFKDYDAVVDYCTSHNIEVVKGDICDTYKILQDKKLMLTFFDTDNYSPSRAAMDTCFQQTVKGGIFAFDHFVTEERFIYTIGERLAAKEFLKGKKVFHLHDTGIIMKL